jgi:hypothetical protein
LEFWSENLSLIFSAPAGKENKKVRQNAAIETAGKIFFIHYLLFIEPDLTYSAENIKSTGKSKRSGNKMLIHDIRESVNQLKSLTILHILAADPIFGDIM